MNVNRSAETPESGELLYEGNYVKSVTLESCCDTDVTRPRIRPVSHFHEAIRVEFPRDLRSSFPIGTRFLADIKVAQKHSLKTGERKGPPYLVASNIGVIVSSIKDKGLQAKLKSGSISGRAYYYLWKDAE
jgi:hypothetical protein